MLIPTSCARARQNRDPVPLAQDRHRTDLSRRRYTRKRISQVRSTTRRAPPRDRVRLRPRWRPTLVPSKLARPYGGRLAARFIQQRVDSLDGLGQLCELALACVASCRHAALLMIVAQRSVRAQERDAATPCCAPSGRCGSGRSRRWLRDVFHHTQSSRSSPVASSPSTPGGLAKRNVSSSSNCTAAYRSAIVVTIRFRTPRLGPVVSDSRKKQSTSMVHSRTQETRACLQRGFTHKHHGKDVLAGCCCMESCRGPSRSTPRRCNSIGPQGHATISSSTSTTSSTDPVQDDRCRVAGPRRSVDRLVRTTAIVPRG